MHVVELIVGGTVVHPDAHLLVASGGKSRLMVSSVRSANNDLT